MFSLAYFRLAKVMTQRQGQEIPLYYKACPNAIQRDGRDQTCNKKCDGDNCPTCGPVQSRKRWLARCIFEDHTDSCLLQCFDSEFQYMSGKPAEEFDEKRGDTETWLDDLCFKDTYKAKLRTATDQYQGEMRGVTRIVGLEKVKFPERIGSMIDEIKALM